MIRFLESEFNYILNSFVIVKYHLDKLRSIKNNQFKTKYKK